MSQCTCLPCEVCGASVAAGCVDPEGCKKAINEKYIALANDDEFQEMLGDCFSINL